MKEEQEYLYRKQIIDSKKEIESLKRDYQKLNQVIEEKQEDLNQILNSNSWKITKPLRAFRGLVLKKKVMGNKELESLPTYFQAYDYHGVPSYTSEYQDNIDFSEFSPLVKTLAFYLPQFHSIKENDKWWGKGFTEWTNTKKAKPLFDGHYLPREPHEDIGYYCLDDIEVLKKQVLLAKQHGLYGFAFYYYWFSGKRLLEKPVDMLLRHPEIDFPFLLCWANENWTRTWDGLEKEILMKQEYNEKDPYQFMVDLQKYISDERYIRINDKPVILVYNPKAIPNFSDVCEKWREAARDLGIGEIIIWSKTEISQNDYSNSSFVDGEFDFAPHGFSLPNDQITGIVNASSVVNYSKLIPCLWDTYEQHYPLRSFSYSVTMGWDNATRRQNGFKIYYNYSLKAFYLWTTMAMKKMKTNQLSNTFLFVNAWNEWGEGTYLEPDKKYGYANINTLSRAICGIPLNANFEILHGSKHLRNKKRTLAVQCHVYYVDVLNDMLKELSNISLDYTLYISTDSKDKKKAIVKMLKEHAISNYFVEIYENKGRDILPMILQMKNHIQKYDYFLHLHTKKSVTLYNGMDWRNYLLFHLLGSKSNVNDILNHFEENEHLGVVYPINHEASFYQLINKNGAIGGNQKNLEKLFQKLEIANDEIDHYMTFPTGSMFFARTAAIYDLFQVVDEEDFECENGQLDGTYAHAIERVFNLLAKKNGYEYLEVLHKQK